MWPQPTSRAIRNTREIAIRNLATLNTPSEPKAYFAAALAKKGTLSELLLPAGYLQIGRPATGNFDAICVDLNGKAQNRENRIVRADHEEILCNWRVRITTEIWPSFRNLAASVIANENPSIYYEEEFENR